MVNYLPRLMDASLQDALKRAGIVLIEGSKGCGKTETARQAAQSEVRVDIDPNVKIAVGVDPMMVLDGKVPRLVDEWQVQPILWDAARHVVDDRQKKGQFIFTGSTAPSELVARHSGAGRFARLKMYTMTLAETGESTCEVSLDALATGGRAKATNSSWNITKLCERMCFGGWPGNLGLSVKQTRSNIRDYLRTIAEVDISTPDGVRRDPVRVMNILRSLARGVSTEMSATTIAVDAGISRETAMDYLDSLSRIFISEDQPAWSRSLRSRTPLRKSPKRHLVDPALVMAALNKGPEQLLKDLKFAGQVFESFVVHELRALTSRQVHHARLENGLEVDALVEMDDVALVFEIKLGHAPEVVDQASENLLRFCRILDGDAVPVVVTGSGMSYQRKDGVHVVAVNTLGK